jgi:isopentenyl-diphosphate delta-isomerase
MKEERYEELVQRQIDFFDIALKSEPQYNGPDFFEDVKLVNKSPTFSLDEIDLTEKMCGKILNAPILIAGMAGGHKSFSEINERFATIAKEFNIGMAVGEQYLGLKNKAARASYEIVRKVNPDGLILGNVGAEYIGEKTFSARVLEDCIQMVQADAIEFHLNSMQNIIWEENASGNMDLFVPKLQEFLPDLKIPTFIKSITIGLSNEDVRMFWDMGISGFDVQGVGGTSFVRMNTMKNLPLSMKQSGEKIISPFDFWGIPTLWSLLDLSLRTENQGIPLIVGGGIRNGIQAVKALALGANVVSMAYPLLLNLMEDIAYTNEKNLEIFLNNFIREMKITMYLLGVKSLEELRQMSRSRIAILGQTKAWLDSRGLKYPYGQKQ